LDEPAENFSKAMADEMARGGQPARVTHLLTCVSEKGRSVWANQQQAFVDGSLPRIYKAEGFLRAHGTTL
jgi:hypothetical protein